MKQPNTAARFIEQSVAKTIITMAIPLLAGTFALTMYQLTNAWFVSRLGTDALAAISFTFPVIMFLMLLTRGLGSGAMTLVAHAIGQNDHKRASRLTAHTFILSIVFAAAITVTGLWTIKPLFITLGATPGAILDMTTSYMRIWYAGSIIMVIHFVASDIIVSTGNMKAISFLMVLSLALNVILDMGLIFGKFGMPKMGIAGAATATLISETVAMAIAVYIVVKRAKLIGRHSLELPHILSSWGKILEFGIPGAIGMILTPVSAAVITKLVAGYGSAAVAAMGVATRMEMFAFMIPATVGVPLIPFIAQNFGAKRIDRIRAARRGAMTFAILYGIFIGSIMILFARQIAAVFSAEPAVINVLCSYLYITSMGLGMMEVHRYAGFTLTGTQKPVRATMLNAVRIIVLLIPLSITGSLLLRLHGIFWGRLLTDILAGLFGIWWSGKELSLLVGAGFRKA